MRAKVECDIDRPATVVANEARPDRGRQMGKLGAKPPHLWIEPLDVANRYPLTGETPDEVDGFLAARRHRFFDEQMSFMAGPARRLVGELRDRYRNAHDLEVSAWDASMVGTSRYRIDSGYVVSEIAQHTTVEGAHVTGTHNERTHSGGSARKAALLPRCGGRLFDDWQIVGHGHVHRYEGAALLIE